MCQALRRGYYLGAAGLSVVAALAGCSTGQVRSHDEAEIPAAIDVTEVPATTEILKAKETARQDYKIAAEDMLHISVYREPDLERDVRVSQAGKISLPLVGEVAVAGLSALEAEAKVQKLLEKQLVDPQVTLSVTAFHAQQVYVLGEVLKPGPYDIPSGRPLTVVGAVALAGGFTKIAALDKTRVVRKSNGEVSTVTVPLKKITAGDTAKDMVLSPDDIVYVPQTFF